MSSRSIFKIPIIHRDKTNDLPPVSDRVSAIFNLISVAVFAAVLIWVISLIVRGIWGTQSHSNWYWLVLAGWFCYMIYIIYATLSIQLAKKSNIRLVRYFWVGMLVWFILLFQTYIL